MFDVDSMACFVCKLKACETSSPCGKPQWKVACGTLVCALWILGLSICSTSASFKNYFCAELREVWQFKKMIWRDLLPTQWTWEYNRVHIWTIRLAIAIAAGRCWRHVSFPYSLCFYFPTFDPFNMEKLGPIVFRCWMFTGIWCGSCSWALSAFWESPRLVDISQFRHVFVGTGNKWIYKSPICIYFWDTLTLPALQFLTRFCESIWELFLKLGNLEG